MNTGENVIFSLPVIGMTPSLNNIRSVICLGNTWTAPLPDDAAPPLAGSGEDAGHGRQFQDAARTLAHRRQIQPPHVNEWDKIEPYKASGFIAEWPVSGKRDR